MKKEMLVLTITSSMRKSFGEGEGRVYESDEDPLDLYSPVEGKIEIKLR